MDATSIYKSFDTLQDFHGTLSQIHSALRRENVMQMCCLCLDYIGEVGIEEVMTPPKQPKYNVLILFTKLETISVIDKDNTVIICELLYHCDRIDLLPLLLTNVEKFKEQMRQQPWTCQLTPYRLLQHNLSKHLNRLEDEQLIEYVHQCFDDTDNEIPSSEMSECQSAMELFILLERRDIISNATVDTLCDAMVYLRRNDLLDLIQRFQDTKRKQASPDQVHPPDWSSLNQLVRKQLQEQGFGNEVVQAAAAPGPQRYHCTSGYCLIVNIDKYEQSRVGNNHADYNFKKREGSELDVDHLRRVFANCLGFHVRVLSDPNYGSLIRTITEVQEDLDVRDYDCFVCCLMAHGKEEHIFTTDKREVNIQEIAEYFNAEQCPSLSGKPKVFVIQACQGRDTQQAISVGQSYGQQCSGVEADNPTSTVQDILPLEETHMLDEFTLRGADFVFCYATVPKYRSYRSKTSGSWYIQALMENIDRYADKHDLMTILTVVNKIVADKRGEMKERTVYQMPMVKSTLRKLLYLKKHT